MEPVYDTWRLTTLTPWPRAVIGLAVAAAILAVALGWRSARREPRRGRRWTLVGLRAAAALLALGLLLEPAIRLLQTARVKNRLAVLVDTSRSMALPVEPGGPTRASDAAAWVAHHRAALERLGDRAAIEWHTFDREAVAADPSALARGVAAQGGATDLLGALRAVASGGAGGRKLAGAVIVSDGADNASLAAGLTPPARAELRVLGVPVNTVAIGKDAPKDLALERVAVDDFAFVRNTVTAEVTVTARGFGNEEVPIVLKREGAVVARATLKLERGKERYTVPLAFAPDVTGTFVFTVSAPVYPGEAVAENNTRSFVLRVIRDRIRVLLVAGRPSWDERFLRGLLKHDPNVDLVSFFILRTTTDDPGPQEELSLIPFPVAEIFGPQLRTFDVVLFVNFAYQPYRALDIERSLPALRDYVKNGGAFAMVGGEGSFGSGRYGETPLAEVLPVSLLAGEDLAVGAVKPRLTAEGRRHPVTRLAEGDAPNEAAWSGLPPLPLYNRTRPLGAADGSTVLLEAPDGGAPIVAVREVGQGRTLAVTTDSSWSWGFLAAEGGGSDQAYGRFWNNALRWLVRDPALTPVQVQPDRPTVDPGQNVGVSISVRAPDYRPAAGASVHAELVADDGQRVAQADGAAGPDGVAHLELAPPRPGAFKVVATSTPACPSPPCPATPAESAVGAVTVRSTGPEDLEPAPRPALLRALAEATGGGYSQGGLPDVRIADPEVVEIGARKDVPIWDRGWALAALVVVLGSEWALRRRWGHA